MIYPFFFCFGIEFKSLNLLCLCLHRTWIEFHSRKYFSVSLFFSSFLTESICFCSHIIKKKKNIIILIVGQHSIENNANNIEIFTHIFWRMNFFSFLFFYIDGHSIVHPKIYFLAL